jgi:hypothetical protein
MKASQEFDSLYSTLHDRLSDRGEVIKVDDQLHLTPFGFGAELVIQYDDEDSILIVTSTGIRIGIGIARPFDVEETAEPIFGIVDGYLIQHTTKDGRATTKYSLQLPSGNSWTTLEAGDELGSLRIPAWDPPGS